MKKILLAILISSLQSLLIVKALKAQYLEKYKLDDFEVTIIGTSTIHDWECIGNELSADIDFSTSNGYIKEINSLKVSIPVKSLKSGKNLMNKKLYDALKANDFPEILFSIANPIAIEQNGSALVVGDLTIAGISRRIGIETMVFQEINGVAIFSGSKKIKMTDFDVVPPEALLGSIKTGDQITIKFQVSFTKEIKL